MKKLTGLFLLTILTSVLIHSCQKDVEVVPENKDKGIAHLLKDTTTIHQYVYNLMLENGWDHCAYFVHEDLSILKSGTSFLPTGPQGFTIAEGEFPFFTFFGGFSALGGEDDWIRINPNGSATLQISSDDAVAEYNDLSNPLFPKFYSGSGKMHMHYTGELMQIPLPGGIYLYTVLEGGHGATVWQGKGDVVMAGTTAPEYKFTAKYIVAGNGKLVKNELKLK